MKKYVQGSAVARVLRDRNAALFLTGVVVSGFGSSAMWLTSGIWVKSLTGSDSLAALTVCAMWLPSMAGPLLGTVADRVRRRPLLVAANVTMTALLPLLIAANSPDRIWLLFAVLVLYGVNGVVQDAAEAALVATALDAELLGDFNGLRMTANEGMKLLAPLTGAGLYARFGGPSVALLDAGTFLVAAGIFALVRVAEERPRRARPRAARASLRGVAAETGEGVRHLWGSPVLRPLVLAGAATMFLASLSSSTLYAVVDKGLGHAPGFIGVLYAVQGAGSVTVGVLSGPLLRRLPARVFGALGVALFAAAVCLRAAPSDAVAFGCAFAVGAGLPCVLIATLTSVQRATPAPLLGRVAATANTLLFAPNAVALAVGSGLVAVVDYRVTLPVTGAMGLVVAGWLFLSPPGHDPSGTPWAATPPPRTSAPTPGPRPTPTPRDTGAVE
ncbi:MFS transporter [Streptomyces sp. NPDC048361]|uniref:MFS transporter n=1 Tax=Streptomyces sp. NPDC048361 TaxID=3154720 RepID=UPI00343F88C6